MATPADEAWKVMICAQETKRAQEALSFLAYILAGGTPGFLTRDQMLEDVSRQTGAEIAGKVETYIRTRLDSINAAITKEGA